MPHTFSASDTKLRRARRHLEELTAEVAAFVASKPARVETTKEALPPGAILRFTMHFSPAPEDISAIVGDVIHNLRTALDLAACELVRAAGQTDEDVYFPFAKEAKDLDAMIRSRNFHRAGPDAIALLQSLKPYKGGNLALRAIHDLDIHDKHRALIPRAISASSPVIQRWEDDGTPNPRVIGDPNAATDVNIVFPVEAGLGNRLLIPTLHELVELVNGIVEAFRALANR